MCCVGADCSVAPFALGASVASDEQALTSGRIQVRELQPPTQREKKRRGCGRTRTRPLRPFPRKNKLATIPKEMELNLHNRVCNDTRLAYELLARTLPSLEGFPRETTRHGSTFLQNGNTNTALAMLGCWPWHSRGLALK